MSFDWSEYLELAKDLAGESGAISTEDAKHRTSISRAYYNVYHVAYQYLKSIDQLPRDEIGMHSFIKEWFKDQPAEKFQDVYDDYKDLMGYRISADYKEYFPELSQPKAFEVTKKSEETIKNIQAF